MLTDFVPTENQQKALEILCTGYPAQPSLCSEDEWADMATFIPFQLEDKGIYATVLPAPPFDMSAAELNATEADERAVCEEMLWRSEHGIPTSRKYQE